MKIIIVTYLFIINLIGYTSMYRDKRKALKNKWRIPENSLIMIGVLGGSIGVYLGMKQFRHKTKHIKFKFGIPAIIILQAILILTFIFKQ